MNSFGVSLVGKSGIYNKKQFFKPDTQKATRTFIFEGGPGCEATAGAGSLGLQFGAYTVSGRWTADNERDVLDVRAFDCYIDADGNEVEPTVVEEKTLVDVCPAKGEVVHSAEVVPVSDEPKQKGIKPRGRKRVEKSAPAEKPAPVETPASVPAAAAKPAADGDKAAFQQRCVELYKSGTTNMTDLAEKMGYERGNGQTRCKRVLQAAGVLQ